MGKYKQRADGLYRTSITLNGKRKYLYAKTQKELDKKLLDKYGSFDFAIHNRVIKSLKFKEIELNELMDLVEILDFNQKYSIFDLINDPGILSDEKERKLLVKYFGKAVWEKEGGKTC